MAWKSYYVADILWNTLHSWGRNSNEYKYVYVFCMYTIVFGNDVKINVRNNL